MSTRRLAKVAAFVAAAVVVLTGCQSAELPTAALTEEISPAPSVTEAASPPHTQAPATPMTPTAKPSPSPTAKQEVTVVSVVDGDTIRTSAGKVRIIGIDSPESGGCGYSEAKEAVQALLQPGDVITLVLPGGQNDTDRYGRLLRYVLTAEGSDIGLMQIESGNAVARYDSTDGYPEHPNEDEYRAAQIATLDKNGDVITTACKKEPVGLVDATPDAKPWWQEYGSCAQLKRNSVGHPTGPFDVNNPDQVEIYNWFNYGTGHRGDGDGDGLACE